MTRPGFRRVKVCPLCGRRIGYEIHADGEIYLNRHTINKDTKSPECLGSREPLKLK